MLPLVCEFVKRGVKRQDLKSQDDKIDKSVLTLVSKSLDSSFYFICRFSINIAVAPPPPLQIAATPYFAFF